MPNTSFRPFTILLIGQAISLFGSSLTGFALGVWAYQQVNSAMIYAIIAVASGLPIFLLSPLAGAAADRWNRKRIIIVAQTAAISITAFLALLYWQNILQVWHIIALVALNSVFSAFVLPTIAATVPMMVPKGLLIRANGMISLAFALIELTGPAASGTLFTQLGLESIFVLDLATFAIGISAVIITRIPQPQPREELEEHDAQGHESIWLAMRAGWHYLRRVPGLFGMIVFYALLAASTMAIGLLVQPMILGFSNAQTLGIIMSTAGSGMLLGSLVMIALKNVNRHVPLVLMVATVLALCCVVTPLTQNPWLLAAGGFIMMSCFPVFDTNNRAIYQRKVEPSMLGRVMGLRNFALGIAQVITLVCCGLLADKVLEPAMLAGGWLQPLLGELYGSGTGRGIAVLISLLGGLNLLYVAVAWGRRSIRRMDSLLADVDIDGEVETANTDSAATAAEAGEISATVDNLHSQT